jgi:GTP cyclohydrolase II
VNVADNRGEEGEEGFNELVARDREHECDGFGRAKICVRIVGVAQLPTRFGEFRIVGFWNNRDGKEHVAMIHGDVRGKERVPTRVHSECLTGDVMGSFRCDCRDQLEQGLKKLGALDCGMLLYLRQEGRGIGLLNKIRAYALQDRGLDTVEANLALGFRDDERDYAIAAHMIASLEVKSIELLTNNPDKVNQLTQHGIVVSGRVPHFIAPNEFNSAYLHTKAERSGHLMPFETPPHLQEQGDDAEVAAALAAELRKS